MGGATAAYGLYEIACPDRLDATTGLDDVPAARLLWTALGARDVASGLAMAAAPDRRAMTGALAARVFFDLADAVLFGLLLPEPRYRRKVASVAGGWALACAVVGAVSLRGGAR